MSELISATLDCYRAVRDATSEAMFFQTFGSMFALTMAEDQRAASAEAQTRSGASKEVVAKALASIEEGGYAAAAVRIGALLARHGEPLPLERLVLRKELMDDYAGLLPDIDPAAWRRLRGEQEVIVRHMPEQALAKLPNLLTSRDDRARLLRFFESVMAAPRIQGFKPNADQLAMLATVRAELGLSGPQQFDIVFSNSTIEHVGDFADQRRMANEVRRVGRRYYIQTPNRYFPIEPHFVFPVFQFLPIAWRVWLVQHFDLGWYSRIPDYQKAISEVTRIRLLTRAELVQLFPEATIFVEKFYGLVKSFVAYTP